MAGPRSRRLERAAIEWLPSWLAAAAVGAGLCWADWPSRRGPRQDGVAHDSGLVSRWSPAGENLIWRADLIGRSTPVMVGDRVCANGRVGAGRTRQESVAYPHNQAASSPLVIGDLVYAVTGNGVDEGHVNIPAPRAPSFIAADKRTGKLVWQSSLPGDGFLHGQWSSPSYGVVDGKPQVLFAGGDGWLYALEPQTGKPIWRFDCNPKDAVYTIGPGSTRNGILAMPVVVGDMVYVAVGEDPEHGEGIGHLWALRPKGEGDLTGKAVVWHRGGQDFHRSLSTVAVHDGLLFTDFSGYVYCLDAATGKPYWIYNSEGAIWGSPLVADGKVYVGNEDGDVAVLRAARKLEVLSKVNMGSAVFSTAVARDGVLYITSRSKLFALAEGVGSHPPAAASPAAAGGTSPRRRVVP
jgi:outer membrane protein assembly factor BamB